MKICVSTPKSPGRVQPNLPLAVVMNPYLTCGEFSVDADRQMASGVKEVASAHAHDEVT